MLGIDLTRISRFEKVSNTFIAKVLHQSEILGYQKSLNKAKYLAQRWAIKEAIYKADNDFVHFNSFAVTLQNRKFEVPGFAISTTGEGDYYLAVAIKEKNES